MTNCSDYHIFGSAMRAAERKADLDMHDRDFVREVAKPPMAVSTELGPPSPRPVGLTADHSTPSTGSPSFPEENARGVIGSSFGIFEMSNDISSGQEGCLAGTPRRTNSLSAWWLSKGAPNFAKRHGQQPTWLVAAEPSRRGGTTSARALILDTEWLSRVAVKSPAALAEGRNGADACAADVDKGDGLIVESMSTDTDEKQGSDSDMRRLCLQERQSQIKFNEALTNSMLDVR